MNTNQIFDKPKFFFYSRRPTSESNLMLYDEMIVSHNSVNRFYSINVVRCSHNEKPFFTFAWNFMVVRVNNPCNMIAGKQMGNQFLFRKYNFNHMSKCNQMRIVWIHIASKMVRVHTLMKQMLTRRIHNGVGISFEVITLPTDANENIPTALYITFYFLQMATTCMG